MIDSRTFLWNELQRAALLLRSSWILVIPPAVISLVVFVVLLATVFAFVGSFIGAAALGGHGGLALLGAGGALLPVTVLLASVAGVAVYAVLIAASDEVWNGNKADLGAATSRSLRHVPQVALATVLIILLSIIPALLCFVGIGFPLLIVLGFLLMYTIPAIILDDAAAVEALKRSAELARVHWRESLIAACGCMIAVLVANIIGVVLSHIPFIGVLISAALGGAATAYAALVVTRFYRIVGGSPATVNQQTASSAAADALSRTK